MPHEGMCCDLHVHSRFSGSLGLGLLGAVARECYSEPGEVYETARRRGMDLVTLTDHDSIEGALRLPSTDRTFVSEEVTCLLPGGREIHVGVFDIDERQHAVIAPRRFDPEALFAFLAEERIPACFNHPFSALTGRRETKDLVLGLRHLSLVEARNGMLSAVVNGPARRAAADVRMPGIGGSDGHTLASVARAYTQVPGARNKEDFLQGLRRGSTIPKGESGSYRRLTADIVRLFFAGYREAARKANQGAREALACGLLLASIPLLPLIPVITAAIVAREAVFSRRLARRLFGPPVTSHLRPPSPGAPQLAIGGLR